MKRLIVFVISALFLATRVEAATLKFTPQTSSTTTNSIMSITIDVDTGGENTSGVDAVINFPNSLVSVESVESGTFYTTVVNSKETSVVRITGYAATGTNVNGTGTLATLRLRALNPGTATLSFSCTTGQTNDSNINKSGTGSEDIIDCAALQQGTYTITGASTTTPTVAPGTATGTTGTTTTSTATITQLPQTGFLDTVGLLPAFLIGIGMIVIGVVPLLL